jgi:hypothetical protein
MTRLALVRLSDNSIVTAPIWEGSRVDLPGVGSVSPAKAGWRGGGELSYEDGQAVEGAAQFALLSITDFATPEGKRPSGPATYAVDGDAVIETIPIEDIPAPVDLTAAEKLANAGLTVADLKTLLGME